MDNTNNNNEVQYFDSDFSFEEHAQECRNQQQQLKSTKGGDYRDGTTSSTTSAELITVDDNDLLPQSQSKFWNLFHTNHSAGNFYKPRRYLTKSFPCILQYFANNENTNNTTHHRDGEGQLQKNVQEDRILLEIGCGSGSSCIPIIKQCSEMKCSPDDDGSTRRILLACDSSSVAVDTTLRFVAKFVEKEEGTNDGEKKKIPCKNILFDAFVADPSLSMEEANVSFVHEVKTAYEQLISKDSSADHKVDNSEIILSSFEEGVAGIVLMVFVLSAVTPSRVERFLEQIYQTTKPGGKVCFRDYGLYDMPMLRFDSTAECKSDGDDPVFVRGEGTIARFFSIESTRELFETAGFKTVELRYCTVFNNNRKTGQKLKRVFVHGVFEKPISG